MSSDNIIQLNIGGTVFEVKKSNILWLGRFDEYFNTILVTDAPVTKDEFRRIFIDRSPFHFKLILKKISDDDVALSDSEEVNLENQKEAQYNQLDGIEKLCEEKIPESLQKLIEKSEKNSIKGNGQVDNLTTQCDTVTLDIGGTIFQTIKSTLTKFNGLFKTIIETNIPVKKDGSGCIIINRDPKHFGKVLNYMRGDVAIPKSYDENIQKNIQELMQEADYYMLDGLIELCKEKIPIELPAELEIIKTDGETKSSINPLLIIDYFADSKDHAFPSDIAEFSSIAERNKEKFEIYFKPFQTSETGIPNSTSNSYRIIDGGHLKYEGNFAEMNPSPTMLPENIIKLNIGGTVFEVPKSTLTKVDGFFKTMMESDDPVIKDKAGCIFIDRDPTHFEAILKYLSAEIMDEKQYPDWNEGILEMQQEARCYQLDDLVWWCQWKYRTNLHRGMDEDFEENERFPTWPTDPQTEIIELNVGGQIYPTTKYTLTKFDGFFKTMMETDIPITKDESGCIVINRDPKYFRQILNFMRDGHVKFCDDLDTDTTNYIQEIQQEADYYLLDRLVQLCKSMTPIDMPAYLNVIRGDSRIAGLAQANHPMPVVVIGYLADRTGRTFRATIPKLFFSFSKYELSCIVRFQPFKPDRNNSTPSYRIFNWRGKVR